MSQSVAAADDVVAGIQSAAGRLRDAIESVFVGKAEVVERVLVALLAGGHILIEDVPGIGKTTLARAIARSLGATFRRVQFTPDLMPADLVGVNVFDQRTGEFQFRPGPLFAQVVLADEINRATPRTQSALLEAMEERQVTVDGVTMALPQPFLVLATQNPIELEGTFPLPEAQLDRFLLRLKLGYPGESEEEQILLRFEAVNPLAELEPVVAAEELLAAGRSLHLVRCDPSVRRYVIALVAASRRHPGLELGASPRASLALFRCARALAAIRGRSYVLPDDVQAMASPVLAHRLILGSQVRLRGKDAGSVVQELLANVPVPVPAA